MEVIKKNRSLLGRSWLSAILVCCLLITFGLPVSAQTSAQMVKNASVAVDTSTRIAVSGQGKDAKLHWYSSRPDMAEVDQNGLVTGISEGASIIYCEVTEEGESTTLHTRVRVLPTITVRNQNRLMEALASGEYGRVVYDTDQTGEVVLLDGEYPEVELVVDAPNLSIRNYANFKHISIREISANTWTEYAVGNRIAISAPNGSLTVHDDAKVSELMVSAQRCNLTIHGKVDYIGASGVEQLTLKGRAGAATIHGAQVLEVSFPASLEVSESGEISVDKGTATESGQQSGGSSSRGGAGAGNGRDTSSSSDSSSDRDSSGGSGGSGGSGSGGNGGNIGGGNTGGDGGDDGDGSGSNGAVTAVTVKSLPDTTAYDPGDLLDLTGLVVTLKTDDGRENDVEAGQFAGADIRTSPAQGAVLSAGDSGVTVTHQPSGHSVSFPISVKDAAEDPVTRISVTQPPNRTTYLEVAALDLTGLVVALERSNGSTVHVPYDQFDQNGLSATPNHGDALSADDDEVVIVHTTGHHAVTPIQVEPRNPDTVRSLSIKSYPKLLYRRGQSLDLTGLSVTLRYSDGATQVVRYEEFDNYDLTVNRTDGEILNAAGTSWLTVTHTPTSKFIWAVLTVSW